MDPQLERERLCREMDALIRIIVDYYIGTDLHVRQSGGRAVEIDNPFIDQLERQLEEKRRRLEALNAVLGTWRYRIWREQHRVVLLLWTCAICAVLYTLIFAPAFFQDGGWFLLPAAACALLFAAAVWSTCPFRVRPEK